MATIDISAPLLDMDDKPTLEGELPITLALALKRAVLADTDTERNPVKPADKVYRFDLFLKLRAGEKEGKVELSAEEISFLKNAVLIFPTFVAGTVRKLLDT